MAEAILTTSQLVKRYGQNTVVDRLDLEVSRGECFGLLGPNGAGKTTTLKLCLGRADPDGGTIEIAGIAVPINARQARVRIGVVPQIDNLDPDFTVSENLVVYSRYFGLPAALIAERLPQLLEFASLTGKANAKIGELSGGMKRRLTLARALVNDPDLLFLDEPTTGLDPQARHLIWDRLKILLGQGKTIFLTTHFMDEAERLCDRIAVLDNGRKIAEGKPRELIAQHIEPEVVEVYGDDAHSWRVANADLTDTRFEESGETVFAYTRDAAPVLARLKDREERVRYLHRAANLEDLFLRLTGREMRDD